jgi:hypothetical protein
VRGQTIRLRVGLSIVDIHGAPDAATVTAQIAR